MAKRLTSLSKLIITIIILTFLAWFMNYLMYHTALGKKLQECDCPTKEIGKRK